MFLQFARRAPIFSPMMQPLALVMYERLLPGTQLVNRLQDLHYRVKAVTDASLLLTCAQQDKPMLVLTDVMSTRQDVCAAIHQLRNTPDTQHLPIISFAPDNEDSRRDSARAAGALLAVGDTALLAHLPELLERALQID